MKERLRFVVELLKKAYARFDEVDGFRLGAAFSYYATFAIFPMILLAVTVIGFFVGDDAPARARMLAAVGRADSPVYQVLDQTLTAIQGASGSRGISAVIGVATLLFSASGACVELDASINKIWGVKPRTGDGITGTIRALVHDRLAAFAIVGGIALSLFASLAGSAVIDLVLNAFGIKHTILAKIAQLALSFTLICGMFLAAFHFIPRVRPPWKTVLPGAILTTLLLSVLKEVFAVYLANLTSYSAYGLAGGVLALATWIYLSSQLIFFGAAITRAHCDLKGCSVENASMLSKRDGKSPDKLAAA